MDPTTSEDEDPSAPVVPRSQQDPPAPSGTGTPIDDHKGRSGKVFVLVMAAVLVAVAVLLYLAAQSLSGVGVDSTGSGGEPTSAEP